MSQSLRHPENRTVLAWLGSGLIVAAGAWAAFIALVPPGDGGGNTIITRAAPRVHAARGVAADDDRSIGGDPAVSGPGADASAGEVEGVDSAPPPRTRGLRAVPNPTPPVAVTVAARPPRSDSASAPSGFDSWLGELVTGAVAFNVLETMRLHELRGVHAVLGVGASTVRLEGDIDEPGPVESEALRVSTVMRATLTGAGFGITPIEPQTQVVSWTEPTEWRWQVEAQKPGTQDLYLTFYALFSLDDTERPRLVATLHRAITVEVTWGQRFASLLDVLKDVHWLWTAVVVPLGLAIYAWRHKHRTA